MQSLLFLMLPLVGQTLGESSPAKPDVAAAEVRTIVAALVKAAEENAGRGENRLKGDALADYYLRRAAATALADKVSPRAFLIALGVGLDDTDLLRKNPLTRGYWKQWESDDDRKRRLPLLGDPSLRNRHD